MDILTTSCSVGLICSIEFHSHTCFWELPQHISEKYIPVYVMPDESLKILFLRLIQLVFYSTRLNNANVSIFMLHAMYTNSTAGKGNAVLWSSTAWKPTSMTVSNISTLSFFYIHWAFIWLNVSTFWENTFCIVSPMCFQPVLNVTCKVVSGIIFSVVPKISNYLF